MLRNLLLSYGSYSCMKVPVGTISQNRSESYHIQGQIRLIQFLMLITCLCLFGSPVGVSELIRIQKYP